MSRISTVVVLLGVALLLVGCVPKESYQVDLTNELDEPITAWLTKSGPPYEGPWRPPEEVALQRPGEEELLGGVVVPAGKAAYTPEMKGQFYPDMDAILRVYVGERTMSELLSMSRGSPDRVDVVLKPGKNRLVVREREGRLVVDPDWPRQ
jgi:hypothetical protein